jgi:hypothetical protein
VVFRKKKSKKETQKILDSPTLLLSYTGGGRSQCRLIFRGGLGPLLHGEAALQPPARATLPRHHPSQNHQKQPVAHGGFGRRQEGQVTPEICRSGQLVVVHDKHQARADGGNPALLWPASGRRRACSSFLRSAGGAPAHLACARQVDATTWMVGMSRSWLLLLCPRPLLRSSANRRCPPPRSPEIGDSLAEALVAHRARPAGGSWEGIYSCGAVGTREIIGVRGG